MTVRHSRSESERFGYRVGRLDIVDDAALADLAEVASFDVVILRAPAAMRGVPARLAQLPQHVALAADHLCYWEWPVDRAPGVELADGLVVAAEIAEAELLDLVRATFAGYGNHYAVNPLFDQDDVLDGYCEWAQQMHASCECFVLRRASGGEGGDALGFAVVDWNADVPDIRLAGMRPEAQGRGWYAGLLSAVMAAAVDRGRAPIRISTQSDNVNVMRAWARLGLVPQSTQATFHLVRTDLLGEPA